MRKQINKESMVNERSFINLSTYNITWKLTSRTATFLKKGSNGRLSGRVIPMKLVQGNIL